MSDSVTFKDYIRFYQDHDSSYATDVTVYAEIAYRAKMTWKSSMVNEKSMSVVRDQLTEDIRNEILDSIGITRKDLYKLELVRDYSVDDLYSMTHDVNQMKSEKRG